jgi:hypothetical protein
MAQAINGWETMKNCEQKMAKQAIRELYDMMQKFFFHVW